MLTGKSENVCPMINCYQVPSQQLGVIVMKKYETDLFNYCLKDSVKLETAQVKRLLNKICLGVKDLHRNGVAHLDLKPENVLIGRKGEVVLCDFGCSYFHSMKKKKKFTIKRKDKKNSHSNLIEGLENRGTKKYSAPEVYTTSKYDPFKADIFSLGTILHVLLTGFYPEPDLSYAQANLDLPSFSLIQMMLNETPELRPTIDDVLASKWFPTISNFRQFSGMLPKFLKI